MGTPTDAAATVEVKVIAPQATVIAPDAHWPPTLRARRAASARADNRRAYVLIRIGLQMSTERGDRIIAAGLDNFARSGYAQTTLGDIARSAGLTEAELQDTFVTKEALVAELTGPLLLRIDALVRTADDADSHDPDEVAGVLGAYLSVLVDHRQVVRVLLGDPTAAECPAVGRLRAGLIELRDGLAGPAGGLDERIRASSALGAVQQAVADSTDVELLTTRAVVIETALAILGDGYRG